MLATGQEQQPGSKDWDIFTSNEKIDHTFLCHWNSPLCTCGGAVGCAYCMQQSLRTLAIHNVELWHWVQVSVLLPSSCSLIGPPIRSFVGILQHHKSCGRFKCPGKKHYEGVWFNIRVMGPFKCYVTLFSWMLDTHPPPHNPNNNEPYTFTILFLGNLTPHPHCGR